LFAEPAFSHSVAWPPHGLGLPPEPDDPRPAFARDTSLAEPRPAAEWVSGSAIIDHAAGEPLQAARAVAPSRRQAWKAAVLVSCLLHAAIALAFLAGADDSVEIAGSDQASVMLLGNAADDQLSAGDGIEATNVTLVTMLDPKPVATVSAEAVTVTDTAQPVQEIAPPVEEITEAPLSELAPERVAEAAGPVLRPSVSETVESVPEGQPAPADPAPEILTAQAAEPTQNVVSPHVGQSADTRSPVPATSMQPERAEEITAEKALAADADAEQAEGVPVPEMKPLAAARPTEPERPVEETPDKPAREKPAKPAGKNAAAKAKPAKKAEKAEQRRKKSGSGGANETDSRRGVADGQDDGHRQVAGKGGSASAAGNAAASNYPGKVAARLRRAVRGISRLGGKARSDVLVSFTVNAGGGLGGLHIARSSGSPELDRAALAVVQRAAPFPPIPPESGRRNWSFTLPLGLH
jgi:protein TonB